MYARQFMSMDVIANVRFQLTNNTNSYRIKHVCNIYLFSCLRWFTSCVTSAEIYLFSFLCMFIFLPILKHVIVVLLADWQEMSGTISYATQLWCVSQCLRLLWLGLTGGQGSSVFVCNVSLKWCLHVFRMLGCCCGSVQVLTAV